MEGPDLLTPILESGGYDPPLLFFFDLLCYFLCGEWGFLNGGFISENFIVFKNLIVFFTRFIGFVLLVRFMKSSVGVPNISSLIDCSLSVEENTN